MEYLLELRKRLLYCFILTILVFGLLSLWANPLYALLTKPLWLQLPAKNLIATNLTAPFLVPIKFSFIVSLFLLAPYFFYQAWSFIAPALYKLEKKIVWALLLPSLILFYSGVFFAYFFVLPLLFHFFLQAIPSHVELLPDIGQYLDFSLQLLFAFGLAFEIPMLIVLLVHFDIASLAQLKEARRYAIVLAFVVAMLLTPPDVLSQIMLAIPLWLLFEIGLILAALIGRYLSDWAQV